MRIKSSGSSAGKSGRAHRVRVGQVEAFNLGYALGLAWALEDAAIEDSAAAGSPAPLGVGSAAAASTRAES